MKRPLLGLGAALALGVAAFSGPKAPPPGLDFKREKRNPVSHLRLNNDPAEFQFAVVSDRTGGHRARVFSRAVEQLNLLQPEFVVCVGDLIEGYTAKRDVLDAQWREFQGYVARLRMPFFYVPGNHDLANRAQARLWKEKFGRSYYHFVYRDVLFLLLNSEDPPGRDPGAISADQLAWLKKTLADNDSARWTLVFVHKPMWLTGEARKGGWAEVEELLAGRPHTVFAGHVHRYHKFTRNGRDYYMLATTGGGSKLRGTEYGEFDHVVWVTMKKEGSVLANVLLDGVLPDDLRPVLTDESGVTDYHRKPTHPARGRVLFNGNPVAGAYVVLQSLAKEPRPPRADALTGPDGRFTLSTYSANDGVPAGQYAVTVEWRRPLFTAEGKPGPNRLPAKYAGVKTTPLEAEIKAGANDLPLELTD
jgi:serine/threonine-protein phosphatase CPPED1